MSKYNDMHKILRSSFNYEFDSTVLTLTERHTEREVRLDFANMDEDIFDELYSGDNNMAYDEAMYILSGGKRYEFNQLELTVTSYNTGEEVTLDFSCMRKEMFDAMSCDEDLDDGFDEDFEDAVSAICAVM